MSSFQDLISSISNLFSKQTRAVQKRQTGLELMGSSTSKLSKAQKEIQNKKEITQLKSKMGELQRSDLGVKISDIETNFYRQALEDFQSKMQESFQKQGEAIGKFQQVGEDYRKKLEEIQAQNKPWAMTSLSQADKKALSSPEELMKLYQQKNEMQQRGFHSAARWMKQNWNNENSYLYKAYQQANEITKQRELSTSYDTQIQNTQRSLAIAQQAAIDQAQITASPLDATRNQLLDTLGKQIINRQTTPSSSILTETKEGPAKKPTTLPKVKQQLRRIEQPSYYEGRPQ